MADDFTIKQHAYWTEEVKKYQNLFIKKVFDKETLEEDKDLYRYAMWYCQEQRAKYR